MAFIILIPGLILMLLAAGYYFARQLVYPRTYSLDDSWRIEVAAGKIDPQEYQRLPKEEISIRSPYGYLLSGDYFPLPGSKKTVIITHGFTYTRYGSVKYIPLFRSRGYNVLIYDLRRHGASGGKNTTFGFYEKHDLAAIVAWCREKAGEDCLIGSMGESMGGAIALQHAAIDPCLAFVIADCSFSTLRAQLDYRIRYDYHLRPALWIGLAGRVAKLLTGMSFDAVSPLADAARIETPVFFIHAARDGYIPPSMSEELYSGKKVGPRRLFIAPNGGHAEAFWMNRQEYDRQIGEFLADNHAA